MVGGLRMASLQSLKVTQGRLYYLSEPQFADL